MKASASSVIIYTDGSSWQGFGGWAALVSFLDDEEPIELVGGAFPTTNNRMEMQAVIGGLEYLTEPMKVHLVSDSAYVLNTLKKKWYDNWSKPRERPNWDLWERLIVLTMMHDLHYVKVRGHQGDYWNDVVDKLAGAARLQAIKDLGGSNGI